MEELSIGCEYEAQELAETAFSDRIDDYVRARVLTHGLLERKCDALLQRQDGIARDIYLATDWARTPGQSIGEAFFEKSPRITSDDFQQLSQLASHILPENFPVLRRKFVLNGCTRPVGELEKIEQAVKVIQLKMREIESEILEHMATTFDEVITKMRFIVGLLLDGAEMDTAYFAFQIEECADVLCSVVSYDSSTSNKTPC